MIEPTVKGRDFTKSELQAARTVLGPRAKLWWALGQKRPGTETYNLDIVVGRAEQSMGGAQILREYGRGGTIKVAAQRALWAYEDMIKSHSKKAQG